DEALGLGGRVDGGNPLPLGPVAVRAGHEEARREEVGAVQPLAAPLLAPPLGRPGRIGGHVEDGGHPEHQLVAQGGAADVAVRIDEARQQRLARALDDLGAGRRGQVGAHRLDAALAHQHRGPGQHPLAVEHPHVADEGDGRRGEGVPAAHRDQDEGEAAGSSHGAQRSALAGRPVSLVRRRPIGRRAMDAPRAILGLMPSPMFRPVAGLLLTALLLAPRLAHARNLMSADGPDGTPTYDLLHQAYTTELPDCGHMVPHITEVFDDELQKNVFVFHAHVNQDDDRCGGKDRQRTEIRAKAADIVAQNGETVWYRWKFKLDKAFQGSTRFTHIFQIKSDLGAPIMTLTPRVSTFGITGRAAGSSGTTDLAKFRGVWVVVDLKVLFSDNGRVELSIRRIPDG